MYVLTFHPGLRPLADDAEIDDPALRINDVRGDDSHGAEEERGR